tara:strand:- start:12382 stop:13011 length:630 start_codon:yes stop_codon:yes gene_type:complete
MLISIGGLIGAGKSTVLEILKETLDADRFIFLNEPVDEWQSIQDSKGVNALQHFYNDPKKYAMSFQTLAFITRLVQLQEALETYDELEPIIITERSLEEDRYVFAEHLHETGLISEIDFKIYEYWFNTQKILPDLQFFLKASPQKCLDRIIKRGRTEERDMDIRYLEALEKRYAGMIGRTNTPVYIIDADHRTPEEVAEEIVKYILLNI